MIVGGVCPKTVFHLCNLRNLWINQPKMTATLYSPASGIRKRHTTHVEEHGTCFFFQSLNSKKFVPNSSTPLSELVYATLRKRIQFSPNEE